MATLSLPLERWFENNCVNSEYFPNGKDDYLLRYQGIKNYLVKNVYPLIGSAISSVDGGIYTDHGPDHFDAVIRYAGKLLDLQVDASSEFELCISPYEVFVLLVSILLHDAGNVFGRAEHEKRPHKIFKEMGDNLCPDEFEAKIISQIASAHSGFVTLPNGTSSRDSISQLNENVKYSDIAVRQQFIAALVRFSDEICEDRSRCARFMLNNGQLPEQSQVHHAYANSISSVSVDRQGKSINLKYELKKEDVLKKFGKESSDNTDKVFLIDEIFFRIEKMYREMIYCQRYMSEHIKLDRIRVEVHIYDDDMNTLKNLPFELKETGYPTTEISLHKDHPQWKGCILKKELDSN